MSIPHSLTKLATVRWLALAVAGASLAIAASCGGDDSSSSTPTSSGGASAGVSISAGAQTPGISPTARGSTPTPDFGPSPVECTNAAADAGLISQVAFGGDSSYAPGEPIDIRLILANCGDNKATLFYPTSQRYNFVVTDPNATEVWRSSDGKAFDQVEGSDELVPYQRITYDDQWDQKDRSANQVAEGQYKIAAFSVGCSIAARTDCEFGPIGFVTIQSPTATPTPTAAA